MSEEQSQNNNSAEPAEQTGHGHEHRNGHKRQRRRTWWIVGVLGVFILGLVAWGVYYFVVGQFHVTTEDAYVGGNQLSLTPQIADTVIAIAADDTDRVKSGQVVITLDHSNQTVALEHAKAALGAAVRDVRVLRQQEAGEKATIALRKTTLAQAYRDFLRNKKLLAVHGVTTEKYQHARTTYQNARQRLTQARHALAALQAQVDGQDLRHTPQVALAIAKLQSAWLNLQRTKIIAPADGYVAQRSVQVGERVKVGEPLLTIVPLDHLWVDANFKETQLEKLRIGQPATVTADTYGGDVIYHGKVAGIAAGTGAAFSLLPPQNATGNWIKILRRVPVRISLPPKELEKHPLRIGLSMSVDVDVSDTSGRVLAALPPKTPRYKTGVYELDNADFKALVARIIAANRDGASAQSSHSGSEDPS